MKRIMIAFFAVTLLVTAVTGCHTTRGAGEDIERAGEKVQDVTQ